jgi:hypothetical protein
MALDIYSDLDLHGGSVKGKVNDEDIIQDDDIPNKLYADKKEKYDTALVTEYKETFSDLGALPAGTDVSGKTIKDILDLALFPDIDPLFKESVLTITGGPFSAMVGYNLSMQINAVATLNDRPSITQMSAFIKRNPEDDSNVLLTLSGNSASYTFPTVKALKTTVASVTAKVNGMLPKLSTHGNTVNPPAEYSVITNIQQNIPITVLYPYFIKLYDEGAPTLDPTALTYADLMSLNVASMQNSQFCETDGAEHTLLFANGSGPYTILIAIYGNVNLKASINGSDDISATFTKTLRTLSVPGVTNVTAQYSLFKHTTGKIPFASDISYTFTRTASSVTP